MVLRALQHEVGTNVYCPNVQICQWNRVMIWLPWCILATLISVQDTCMIPIYAYDL